MYAGNFAASMQGLKTTLAKCGCKYSTAAVLQMVCKEKEKNKSVPVAVWDSAPLERGDLPAVIAEWDDSVESAFSPGDCVTSSGFGPLARIFYNLRVCIYTVYLPQQSLEFTQNFVGWDTRKKIINWAYTCPAANYYLSAPK